MRKILVLLLAVSLLAVSFSGCNKPQEPSVWDGSVAETFSKGDGTQKKPYIIDNASQLAYLAKEVNTGTNFQDKYVVLDCDLNLNALEWTPIGNGAYSFNGIFDGNGHTISNLKITNGVSFVTGDTGEEINQFTTGLFGSCDNATIKNISIDKASVTIQNITNVSAVMGGVLIGTMNCDSTAEISNVNIWDTNINCIFELENRSASLRVGGIIGYLSGSDDSSITLKNINSNTSISIEQGRASYNLVGGVVGAASTHNLFNVSNCASYLSVNIDTENSYLQHNYFGAFGSMQTQNDIVSISNVFSKVTTNKIHDISHGYSSFSANAIAGEIYHTKQKDGTRIGGYEFKNLFGYVEQVDVSTRETAKSTQLYAPSSYVVYTETNCLGCESLPTNHGFDISVWDITNLSNPKVKMN